MRRRGLDCWSVWLVAGMIVAMAPLAVLAQTSGNNSTSGLAGVSIDANGVLRTKVYADPDGQLMKDRIAAARATLGPKVTAFSKLRKISLNRLEQVILDREGTLTDEMRYVAGLLRVRYVFYYPDSKDIVLAGPAEGWVRDATGRPVGMTTARPVVQLQDLVVALRAFPPGGKSTPQIGCSIDPTPEGLAAKDNYQRSHYPNQNNPGPYAEGLRNSLGMENVRVDGVSPKTHFARVAVEADYRMKLIGIGLEQPPVKLASYVERAKGSSQQAMQRWYFVPDYQCVRESGDRLAMELVGDGVKLISEDEFVTQGGQRMAANRADRASHAFVTGFTKKYPELAARSPIYAELRNLIDMVVAAAYIQQQDYYAKAGWEMPFFGSEKRFSVEIYDVPRMVEPAVNVVWKGTTLMTPIGGGINIRAAEALDSENLLPDKKDAVSKLHAELKPNLAKGQWWWD
jgi:hypothetical protein